MLATSERIHGAESTTIVWHGAAHPEACDGQCDWHAIMCSTTEGITMPGSLRDVPLDLDVPGEYWCPDCRSAIQARTDTEPAR
ncbi:hypothetical protein [Streptomyces sp. NPDC015350]|uniref:hypothetical protein n=1 Tax=Streptomyces sp. NPDC015350 TaxID=3364955 RepID=UPI00370110B0